MKAKVAIEIISFLLILLFVYAALNKLNDYEKFVIQIGQSPLLIGLGPYVAPSVIAAELIIPILLIFASTRLVAFYLSFILMLMFTFYIVAILKFSTHIPCSCGGVLEKLTWNDHLIFNVFFVLLAMGGVVLESFRVKNVIQQQIV